MGERRGHGDLGPPRTSSKLFSNLGIGCSRRSSMPHVITVVRYYSGGKASWGKGGHGDLGPPRTSLNLLFTWEGQSLV